MGGGLMQLVAYGAQDVYLTGNPQITFFKVVYRRHTNFAMEVIELTLNGNPDFGRRTTVTITRNGDLITHMYLKVELAAVTSKDGSGQFAWVRRLGHALINYVEVDIGGSQIDKQYGQWLDVWYELSHTTEQERGYAAMIGDVPALTTLSSVNTDLSVIQPYTLFIPLQFWFNRNTGLALPLIALQYHEVQLQFQFTNADQLTVQTTDFNVDQLMMQDASLLVDYIYLDSEERRRFAQVGHEYLIEQLQFTGTESAQTNTVKIKLGFNHPCKEIVWAVVNGNYNTGSSTANAFLGYTDADDWTSALQMAADNIATGMVVIGAANASPAPGLLVGSVSGTYQVPNSDGANILVNVEIATTTTDATDSPSGFSSDGTSTPPFEAWAIYLLDNPVFQAANQDLADSIEAMNVVVTGQGPSADATVFTVAVNVTSHALTIRDISIPVSAWTDNRNNTANGVNPNDVLIYQYNNYGLYIDGSGNPVSQALIQLNGHDRFDIREGPYFNYVQPYQHHTHTPADGINVYSFALHAEQHQPSGTCNLSRIDNTQLNIIFASTSVSGAPALSNLNSDSALYIYAVNYNVLRIMSGMGGLAYSN
jgi:hypothetical protein